MVPEGYVYGGWEAAGWVWAWDQDLWQCAREGTWQRRVSLAGQDEVRVVTCVGRRRVGLYVWWNGVVFRRSSGHGRWLRWAGWFPRITSTTTTTTSEYESDDDDDDDGGGDDDDDDGVSVGY